MVLYSIFVHYSVFVFQVLKWNTCSNVTFRIMKFTVEKGRILSDYRQIWSIVLRQRWVRRILKKYPPHCSDHIRWEQLLWMQEVLVTEVVTEDQEQVKELSDEVNSFFRLDLLSVVVLLFSRIQLSPTMVNRILRKCFFLLPPNLQKRLSPNEVDNKNRS